MEHEPAHLRTQEGTIITNLPTEVLGAIVSFLPRNPHLVQVALVSKRFKDVVEPFLYRSISLNVIPLDKEEGYQRRRPDDLDRFYWLVETLTQTPHLCRFVVALCLSVIYGRWSQDFNDHHQLITLLPSLKELTLSPPPPRLILPTSNRLQILRFDLHDYFQQYGGDNPELHLVDPLELVAQQFWIPTLRSLRFRTIKLHRGRRGHLFPRERYRTSPITDLGILRCNDEDLDLLTDILLSVGCLKRFTLEIYAPPWAERLITDGISPDWPAQALQPHQSTLVDLVIARSDPAAFLRAPLFGSLASYINLKRLDIPETFLVQRNGFTFHEWLPPSLEILQLQFPLQHNEDLDEELPLRFERLEHLAENKLACLPALTRVIWWNHYYHHRDGSYLNDDQQLIDRMDRLVGKFKEVGVKLELRSTSSFAGMPLGKDNQWYYGRDYGSNWW